MTDALPPDDPYGDRAWQAAKTKGRRAILEAAEDWRPDGDGAEDWEPPSGSPPGEDRPPSAGDDDGKGLDQVIIPRIVGKVIRWVPISLPDDCPVTPLGEQGGVYWFLNPHGELVGLKSAEFGQAHIDGLFAPRGTWLDQAFPQFDQARNFKGFQAQYARRALMTAAGTKGVFDARDKVRGLGCWRTDEGQLVQHLGDRILIGDEEHKPGELGGYVYPGRPAVLPPVKGGTSAVRDVYAMFQTWKWARGELDARLLLGFVGCAIMGAALDWRPMCFITGDAGYGKSELMNRIKSMLPGRLVSTVDASPAALRQIVNQDAVGVLFDEIEADALTDQAQNVLKLARVAASGGTTYRGGKDHNASEFTLRGCFGFSAIVPPSMRQQDMQRLAFFRLVQKPSGKLASLTPTHARALGCALAGRIQDGWERWPRILDAWKQALIDEGHDARSSAQFGTLLAAGDMLLNDADPNSETLEFWARQLRRDGLFEYENSTPAWMTVWRTILQAQPEVWRSDGFPTVAEILRRYVIAAKGLPATAERGELAPNEEERNRLHDKLGRAGLAVVQERGTGRLFLAIPSKHQAVASIFQGSDYQARGGEGAWSIVLRNAPALNGTSGVYRVEKVPRLGRQRCTLYWLGAKHEGEPIFDLFADEHDIDQLPEQVAAA